MDQEDISDCFTGFSDEDFDGLDSDKDLNSDNDQTNDKNLDLMTAILEQSAKRSQTKTKMKQSPSLAPKSEGEDISKVLARMKEMENELSQLRDIVARERNESEIKNNLPARRNHQLMNQSRSIKSNISCDNTNRRDHGHPDEPTAAQVEGSKGRDVASKVIAQRKEDKQAGIVTEKYSGFRIRNPLISSEVMKQRMNGRKMVKINKISCMRKEGDIDGDWVTIGIVVDKFPPRDTVKGNKYTIWKLSDLSSQTAVISLFLFGAAFQSHWKTSIGKVIAILNPNIMADREVSVKSAAKNQQRVAVSIDNPQKLMIMGDSQDYTTCKGVTKSGKKCGNFANLSDGGYCDYHICRAYSRSRAQRMEFQNGYGPSVSRGTLKEKLFKNSKTEVYYYGGQSFTAPPKSSSSNNSLEASKSCSRLFAPGAKSSMAKVMLESKELRDSKEGNVVSGKGVVTQKGSDIFVKMLKRETVGARNLLQHQNKRETAKTVPEPRAIQRSASELLNEHNSSLPLLGRGSRPGDHVDLFSPPNKPSFAKMQAISFVRKNGSINRIYSSTCKSEANSNVDKIMKRVRSSRGEEEEVGINQDEVIAPSVAKKKKRNSIEIEKLINAKSSHDWINKKVELEREEEYFDRLEERENIEMKKSGVTELKVTVVRCKVCNYTAESQGELCSKEKHHLTRFKVTKKGFSCKGCNQKTHTYDSRWPVDACKKCGETSYEPASIYNERKGPVLPTEQLLLRGIEEKFLS